MMIENSTVDGIEVNPVDEPDFFTPNEDRNQAEIDKWWGRPFIKSQGTDDKYFGVWCLDGGAHDRPTKISYSEAFETPEDAVAWIKRQGLYVDEAPQIN